MARATRAKRTDGTGSAADFLPERRTLPALRRAAAGCRGCHLWKVGTQTVFGEGTRTATVMFVGEQPGDQEDRAGHPFVGPSGRLLDGALERAGLDRRDAYVTNAVKHFKWVPDRHAASGASTRRRRRRRCARAIRGSTKRSPS